jgi:hypothetical protein
MDKIFESVDGGTDFDLWTFYYNCVAEGWRCEVEIVVAVLSDELTLYFINGNHTIRLL